MSVLSQHVLLPPPSPFFQLYTVAKDGAVVVWECSMTLTEMQEYIRKMREGRDGEKKGGGSEEEGAGEEEGDTQKECEAVEGSGDEGDSDGEPVAMETVAIVTRPGEDNDSSSESETQGMYQWCMRQSCLRLAHM